MLLDSLLSYALYPFKETPTSYTIKFCLPGVGKNNIKVKVQGTYLLVSIYENTLSYPIPTNVNVEKVEAKYEDGILTVFLGKDKMNSRDIEII